VDLDAEFGTGLRGRLELVRTVPEEPVRLARRDISPELMLVSPEPSESLLAEILAARAREA
jgi:hypothetical protein